MQQHPRGFRFSLMLINGPPRTVNSVLVFMSLPRFLRPFPSNKAAREKQRSGSVLFSSYCRTTIVDEYTLKKENNTCRGRCLERDGKYVSRRPDASIRNTKISLSRGLFLFPCQCIRKGLKGISMSHKKASSPSSGLRQGYKSNSKNHRLSCSPSESCVKFDPNMSYHQLF